MGHPRWPVRCNRTVRVGVHVAPLLIAFAPPVTAQPVIGGVARQQREVETQARPPIVRLRLGVGYLDVEEDDQESDDPRGDLAHGAAGEMGLALALPLSRVFSLVGAFGLGGAPAPGYSRAGRGAGDITMGYLGPGLDVRFPPTGLEAEITLGGGCSGEVCVGYAASLSYSFRAPPLWVGPYVQRTAWWILEEDTYSYEPELWTVGVQLGY